jgi:hypothetical protein
VIENGKLYRLKNRALENGIAKLYGLIMQGFAD